MEAANAIDWIKPPSFALNSSQAPLFEWFTDAEVNTCYNALDRHVKSGRADQTGDEIIASVPTMDGTGLSLFIARQLPV